MKLQSVELDISKVIPENVQNILSLFSLHVFVNFMEKELFTNFYCIFDYFARSYKVTKF